MADIFVDQAPVTVSEYPGSRRVAGTRVYAGPSRVVGERVVNAPVMAPVTHFAPAPVMVPHVVPMASSVDQGPLDSEHHTTGS